jgi:peptidoglycan/xylan/chitin deacetylase (PgdA/CDA1 family)
VALAALFVLVLWAGIAGGSSPLSARAGDDAKASEQTSPAQIIDALGGGQDGSGQTTTLWPVPAVTDADSIWVPPATDAEPPAVHPFVPVPVLMYHYIRVNPVPTDTLGFGLSVTPADFAAQMAYLHAHDAHTVTLHQVMDALDGGTPLPEHPIVLTFDDGHDDFATVAVPILRLYGFVGTTYVVSGFLGRTSYLTAEQVLEVDRAGMTVGAHTVNHIPLAEVAQPEVAQAEIVGSKQLLEQLLGHPVRDFAYPYGSYNATDEALVAGAGFEDAVSTHGGRVAPGADRWALERREVLGGEDLATFAAQADLPPPG